MKSMCMVDNNTWHQRSQAFLLFFFYNFKCNNNNVLLEQRLHCIMNVTHNTQLCKLMLNNKKKIKLDVYSYPLLSPSSSSHCMAFWPFLISRLVVDVRDEEYSCVSRVYSGFSSSSSMAIVYGI